MHHEERKVADYYIYIYIQGVQKKNIIFSKIAEPVKYYSIEMSLGNLIPYICMHHHANLLGSL